MGAVGGSIWHAFKGARNSPANTRLVGARYAVMHRAPMLGGTSFGSLSCDRYAITVHSCPSRRISSIRISIYLSIYLSIFFFSHECRTQIRPMCPKWNVNRCICNMGRTVFHLRLFLCRYETEGGSVELNHGGSCDGRYACRARGIQGDRTQCRRGRSSTSAY